MDIKELRRRAGITEDQGNSPDEIAGRIHSFVQEIQQLTGHGSSLPTELSNDADRIFSDLITFAGQLEKSGRRQRSGAPLR